jgi:molecular chaperone DnaK
VEINVLQGERAMAADNVSLGKFLLTGIPPAPRGIPQIEVSFDIDASGILHVAAKDLGTGKEENLTITAPQRLSDDEIDRMVGDAEQFAEEDRRRKELADTKNQADSLVYATEKMLGDVGDKVEEATRKAVEEKVENLKKALETDDLQRLKEGIEELNAEAQKIGTEVYQKAQEERAKEEAEESDSASDEDVVDAEFEDVDDEND